MDVHAENYLECEIEEDCGTFTLKIADGPVRATFPASTCEQDERVLRSNTFLIFAAYSIMLAKSQRCVRLNDIRFS